jgi:hypothetical protein
MPHPLEPAGYSNTDTAEIESIQTLEQLLEPELVKHDIKRRDKVPNVDGWIELVDEARRPIGKLEVQVRKIGDGATSDSCGTSLIAYSQRVSSPVIYVGVDVKNRRAYWRHVAVPMVELKEGKDSCTIKFDPVSDGIGPGFPYVERWQSLTKDYQERISNFPKLRQEFTDSVRLTDVPTEDRLWFQSFVDLLNRYLDEEVPGVKDLFFADTWKLGVAITGTSRDQVSYSLYKVPKGENAPLLISVPGQLWHLFESGEAQNIDTGGIPISVNLAHRSALASPETEAKKEVSRYASKIFQERRLKIRGTTMCIEHIFRFLDEFHFTLGIDAKDEYEIGELRQGLYAYFHGWHAVAFSRYRVEWAHLLNLRYPSFAMISAAVRISREEVEAELASNRHPVVPVIDEYRQLRSLSEALDYLFQRGVERVQRPYVQRSPGGRWIWNGFSADGLLQNLSLVFEHLHEEYREFIEANGFVPGKLGHCQPGIARIYAADLSAWANLAGFPSMKSYTVEDKAGALLPVQFINTSDISEPNFSDSRRELLFNGTTYPLRGWSQFDPARFFGRSPLLNSCYQWLAKDLSAQLGQSFSVQDF